MVPDHDTAVATVVMVIPAAVPAAIMIAELDARAAVVVAITVIIAVAANAHTELGRAGDRRRGHRNGRDGSECVGKLPHILLLSVVAPGQKTNAMARSCRNSTETFLNGCSPS